VPWRATQKIKIRKLPLDAVWEYSDVVREYRAEAVWRAMEAQWGLHLTHSWNAGRQEVNIAYDSEQEYDYNFRDMSQTSVSRGKRGRCRAIRVIIVVAHGDD